MRKTILIFACTAILISCDFKDKSGNAPLIENSNGNLIDNPAYQTDQQIEYDKNMESARARYKASEKDDASNIDLTSEPTAKDRENFAVSFKPKTGKNEISLSGENKTTIKFTGAFNTDFTLEQFENLDYFNKMKSLGFKKVKFSNGIKNFGTKDL